MKEQAVNRLDVAATLMADLFAGREGSSAIKGMIDGRKTFYPYRNKEGKDIPLSTDVCKKHLLGELSLGSYPLDQNDMVKWAAVDFDGKKGNALQDALQVKDALEKNLGLVTWIEKSQSGNGIHLWAFFDKKLSAKIVRSAIGRYIPEFDVTDRNRTTSFDRMFPNQDSAGGGWGNLCALPLNGPLVKEGKTAFLDEKGEPLPDQFKTVMDISIYRNNADVLTSQALTKEKIEPRIKKQLPIMNQVPGGTKLLAPQGCAWLRDAFKRAEKLSEPEWYAALCQFAKVEQGDVLAHRFSEPYPNYKFEDTQKMFEAAKKADKPHTCETIWEMFGDCGKRCGSLGVKHPWEIAKVPLNKLDADNKGKIYDARSVADAGIKIVNEISEGKRIGYAWGYNLLDDFTELRPRNLVVVAARPGIGKTAVMIDASVNMAERGVPQYIISLEMGHEELALRYLARLAHVDHDLIVTNKLGKVEMEAIRKAHDTMSALPIFIDDSTREFDRMLDNTGELTYKNGKGVVWVDYLQFVKKKAGETKKDTVDRFLDGFKQMSKIVDSPVITLAQLNRGEEFAEGDDELDSWLKDSGDIEQTADVIHYIRGQRAPGAVERKWRLHKERHRPSGINFKFVFHQGIFKLEPVGYWNKRTVTEDEQDSLGEI